MARFRKRLTLSLACALLGLAGCDLLDRLRGQLPPLDCPTLECGFDECFEWLQAPFE